MPESLYAEARRFFSEKEFVDLTLGFEALKSRGVKFDTEVLEYPWGFVAVFQDPDGNRLQLRQGR